VAEYLYLRRKKVLQFFTFSVELSLQNQRLTLSSCNICGRGAYKFYKNLDIIS